jgi:hypothetical protein
MADSIRIGIQSFTLIDEILEWCNTCKKFATRRCLEPRNRKCKVTDISSGMMSTECPRCKRAFHVHALTVEEYASVDQRIHCMCCQFPEHWQWKRFPDGIERFVERETPRRRLDVEKDRLFMPGELEKQQLRDKQLQLVAAKGRLPELQQALINLTVAIEKTRAELEILPAEIEMLESLVSAAQTDPMRETRFRLAKREEKLRRILRDQRIVENNKLTLERRGNGAPK